MERLNIVVKEGGKMSEEITKVILLKCLVGSRGYGIYDEDSDYDYRGVYIVPTEELLKLGYKYKGTHWIEGDIDNTSYELGHFLHLASKCNPTILHTLKAPIVESYFGWGKSLRKLFPHLLDFKQCYNAFTGYGMNQRKKMIENKDDRWNKYGVAYIRQLYYLWDLIRYGDYKFEITEDKLEGNHRVSTLRHIRSGKWTAGQILDYAARLKNAIDFCIDADDLFDNPPFKQDMDTVNWFLLWARKQFWTIEARGEIKSYGTM